MLDLSRCLFFLVHCRHVVFLLRGFEVGGLSLWLLRYSGRGQSAGEVIAIAAEPGSNVSPDVVDANANANATATCDGCVINLIFRLAREFQDSTHTLSILDTLAAGLAFYDKHTTTK